MNALEKRKDKPKRHQAKPKPVRYLNWRDMPYEGCGPMYEYPHYCPVHLFTATSTPETLDEGPLHIALLNALKRKFERLDTELKEQQIENMNEKKSAQCRKPTEESQIEWKPIPRKTYHMPLIDQGDSKTTKDKSTNVRCADQQDKDNNSNQCPKRVRENELKTHYFRAGLQSD